MLKTDKTIDMTGDGKTPEDARREITTALRLAGIAKDQAVVRIDREADGSLTGKVEVYDPSVLGKVVSDCTAVANLIVVNCTAVANLIVVNDQVDQYGRRHHGLEAPPTQEEKRKEEAVSADFFLYMKQFGQGCDYSISCGEKLVPMQTRAKHPDCTTVTQAAIQEAMEIIQSHGGTSEDSIGPSVQTATIFVKAASHTLNLTAVREKEEAEAAKAEEAERLEVRRQTYLKLKQEFGDAGA